MCSWADLAISQESDLDITEVEWEEGDIWALQHWGENNQWQNVYVVAANSARLCVFTDLGEPLLTPKMLNGSQPIHNILHADGGAGSFEEDVQPGDECSYRALPYALWVSLSAELEAAYAKDALSDHAYEDDTDNGDDTARSQCKGCSADGIPE